MDLHNQMEDRVTVLVDEIFADEGRQHRRGFCVCRQCELDVACYVLNRLPPRYVVSGRGIAHIDADYAEKLQENADVVALVHEGIEVVSRTRRPDFPHTPESDHGLPDGPLYNFPIIKGSVFFGGTFEPASGIEISLFCDGDAATMVDPNWQNPFRIPESVPGTYLFWQQPRQAAGVGLACEFELELRIDDPKFAQVNHFVTLALSSDSQFLNSLHTNNTHLVEDIYLFPK